MSYLKITAIGNLGRDPELRYTQDGKSVASFSMATSEKRKDKNGEMKETTTWLRVTFFGRQAETVSKYLSKGKPVYIEGRGRLEEWTDRDGKNRTTLEVFGTEMQFIGSKGDSGGGRGDNSDHDQQRNYQGDSDHDQRQQPAASALSLDDDIPF